MVAIEVHRPPRDRVAARVVGVGVVIRMRESVMSQELKTLSEALLYFYLESVVGTGCIVTIVVAKVEWDPWE